MTLNLLFFTIIIKKYEKTSEEIYHEQEINRIMDEHNRRNILMGGSPRI
ncbi:hypothetical protein NCCP28_07550 [Niallia sp. NCCP-28]|nr:hypothetical protein NCCP28_07550 [Niallia sp. NCCP-28]